MFMQEHCYLPMFRIISGSKIYGGAIQGAQLSCY